MAESRVASPEKPEKPEPRAHLSDLFKTGRDVTIADNAGTDYLLWMVRPTATQQDEAREAANGRMLRLKLEYDEKDSNRYLTLKQTMEEIDDKDELLDLRSRYKEADLRSQAFNEVLFSEDFGTDWQEDNRYLGLLDAISTRWEEIQRFNDEMEEAEADDRILPEEDEQLTELLKKQEDFQKEQASRLEELIEEEKANHVNKPLAQLRNEIVKESIDTEARLYWYETYQVRMLYYACRDPEEHGHLYFEKSEDVLELPQYIRQELYRQYEELERGSEELKNSLSLPSS
jgi:hypothetical protein